MRVTGIDLGFEGFVVAAQSLIITFLGRQHSNRHGVLYYKDLLLTLLQETLNYWKQLPHILKYFRAEEDPTARLPKNFMSGFLEGRN